MMACLKLLVMMGGGGLKVFPLFLFVKTIENVISVMRCVNFFGVVVLKRESFFM